MYTQLKTIRDENSEKQSARTLNHINTEVRVVAAPGFDHKGEGVTFLRWQANQYFPPSHCMIYTVLNRHNICGCSVSNSKNIHRRLIVGRAPGARETSFK